MEEVEELVVELLVVLVLVKLVDDELVVEVPGIQRFKGGWPLNTFILEVVVTLKLRPWRILEGFRGNLI